MNKLVATFALLLVLSISAFAEGQMGAGGKTCPPGQTCLVGTTDEPKTTENSPVSKLIKYLKALFG